MRVLTDYILRDDEWTPAVHAELGCPFTLAIDGAFVPDQPAIVEVPDAFLAFRQHPAQWSQHPDRDVMYAEARIAQQEPFC